MNSVSFCTPNPFVALPVSETNTQQNQTQNVMQEETVKAQVTVAAGLGEKVVVSKAKAKRKADAKVHKKMARQNKSVEKKES